MFFSFRCHDVLGWPMTKHSTNLSTKVMLNSVANFQAHQFFGKFHHKWLIEPTLHSQGHHPAISDHPQPARTRPCIPILTRSPPALRARYRRPRHGDWFGGRASRAGRADLAAIKRCVSNRGPALRGSGLLVPLDGQTPVPPVSPGH